MKIFVQTPSESLSDKESSVVSPCGVLYNIRWQLASTRGCKWEGLYKLRDLGGQGRILHSNNTMRLRGSVEGVVVASGKRSQKLR